ncbi:MAG: PH domain-containing protein [Planctomycetota bacterium]
MSDTFRNQTDSSADEPEVELWSGGFSGKSMFGSWFAAGVTTLAVVLLISFVPDLRGNNFVRVGGVGVIVLIWAYLVGVLIHRKLGMFYVVTTQRLKHREGFLFRKLDRIELIDIDDVTYRQGPVQAALQVGDICIRSSDSSHPELTMYGIADVSRVADMIDNARREERRKRGLHIEAI